MTNEDIKRYCSIVNRKKTNAELSEYLDHVKDNVLLEEKNKDLIRGMIVLKSFQISFLNDKQQNNENK